MARIVYGVSGEGSGHSTRARVVLRHLLARGHELRVASYDRGFRNLRDEFDVLEIEGLALAGAENRVSKLATVKENLRKLRAGARKARTLERELFDGFRPDLVLCDFEPQTAWLAQSARIPLVSIDNQHFLRYVKAPQPAGLAGEARLTRAVVRAIVPRPARAIITSFFTAPLADPRAVLVPPILREEVLALRPTRGEHVLVYFTRGFESYLEALRTLPRVPFRVYGCEREGREGNVEFKRASGAGFLADLAAARAVVATAGFSLIGEALQLAKPYLALPMRGQYEQELNAFLLEQAGYGKNGRGRDAGEALGDFLFRVPDYEERLQAFGRTDNRQALRAVDAAVREFAG